MRVSNISQRKVGVILAYIAQAVNILSGVLYTPIMIKLLGQSEYGLYQLVNSVVSYLSLLSFGFSNSYIRFYSRYKVKGDQEGISRLNGMFMIIFLLISLVCVLCGGGMLLNIENIFGTGLALSEYPTARILMFLMIINLAITFPSSVFDSYTSAHERFFYQQTIVILSYLLNPFITLPLLLMGYRSVAMVCVSTGLTFTKLIVNMIYCLSELKMKFNFRGFQFGLLKEMWVFTFFIFINLIVDQINWNVDKFLLGRMIGTAAVAIYGVGGQLNSMYLQFSNSISSVFIPKVNKIIAESNDNKQITKLFTEVGRIQFIVLMLVLSGFIFFGKPFIILWAGEEYTESYSVSLLLMAASAIPMIQNLGIEIQRAKNMHKARSFVYLVIAIGNVFLSIPLIKAYGSAGAAVGTALSLLVGNGLFMNWYYYKRIGIDIIYFWKHIISFFPALIVVEIYGILIARYTQIDNFFSLMLPICIYTVAYCMSMWFLGMNEDEKRTIFKMFKRSAG